MSRALFALSLATTVLVIALSACEARVQTHLPVECDIAVTVDGKRRCLEYVHE